MKYVYEGQIVAITSEQDGYAFGHYEGDVERRFMAPLSEVSVFSEVAATMPKGTGRLQAGYSKGTDRLQTGYSEDTGRDSEGTGENKPDLSRQRSFLVVKALLQEVEEKWDVLAFFEHPDAYQGTRYSFASMLAAFESGEIKNCPNPVVANMNLLADANFSRKWYTRSLALLIAYQKQYYPPIWLQMVDKFLGFFIKKMDVLIKIA